VTRRTAGSGCVYRPRYRGADKTLRKSRLWWIAYTVGDKRVRESTRTHVKKAAEQVLRDRLGDVAAGRPAGPAVAATTLTDLVRMLEQDYKANRRRSLKRVRLAARHLLRVLGATTPARTLSKDAVTRYVATRLDEKAAAATINRELAALRRMMRLGHEVERVARVPAFTPLQEDNARKGFFEVAQLRTILRHLPPEIRPVIEAAYETGWRVTSEVLTRQWRHVDLKAGWLRLEPGETKNREGRMFPLTPRLRRVLVAQRRRTKALEKKRGRVIPWVFHREGEEIRVFWKDWRAARKAAGLPGKLVHDFRRTAVRNLIRAGVAQRVAMTMVGLKTDSIFRRYAIVDETLLREAGAKLAQLGHRDSTVTSAQRAPQK
jgi:site-specific recombinase XerD